jgi:hypothetical protein
MGVAQWLLTVFGTQVLPMALYETQLTRKAPQ